MTDEPDQNGPDTGDDPIGAPALVIRLRVAAEPTPPPPGARPMRVVTFSGSVCKLDPRTMTAYRLPDGGAELRRDGERVHLLSWPEPVLGECLELYLMVREDGVPTVRLTTPVVRIDYR
jgi:hypothetical protein